MNSAVTNTSVSSMPSLWANISTNSVVHHFETLESYLPFSLRDPFNFLLASLTLTAIVALRYFLFVGIAWWAVYKKTSPFWRRRLIYKVVPSLKTQLFEIKWSMVNAVIFGVSGAILGLLWELGFTQIYLPFEEFGFSYLMASFLLMSILHDFYFYVTHRALHTTWLFRRFHSIHHKSLEPSPWASFSFHPVEGLIQALALPLLAVVLPVHPTVLLVYLTFMTLSAIINHLGFEVLPRGVWGFWLGRWFVTGTHHSEHHKHFKTNFGLFFTFWDRVLKTEDPAFDDDLRRVLTKATGS